MSIHPTKKKYAWILLFYLLGLDTITNNSIYLYSSTREQHTASCSCCTRSCVMDMFTFALLRISRWGKCTRYIYLAIIDCYSVFVIYFSYTSDEYRHIYGFVLQGIGAYIIGAITFFTYGCFDLWCVVHV